MKKITLGLAVALTASTLFFLNAPNGKEKLKKKPPTPMENWFLESEKNTIKVFEEAAPLVVFVHNFATVGYPFSFRTSQVQQGSGSGFIWDEKGHIVTNFHVIQGSDEIAVTLQNGSVLKAKLVGFESRKDLAVIKVNPKYLPGEGFRTKSADARKIRVGQKTIAIGNPFGLDHTLTVGNVSALNRSMETFGNVTIRDMIQTDAAINPGNSGGPLLDSRGWLIGMNTSIISGSGSSAGIGFAVPANTIKRFVDQIIEHGKVIQPGLGFVPFDPKVQSYYLGDLSGVVVREVIPNSGADKAGLQGTRMDRRRRRMVLGDVIVGIDGEEVGNYDDLYNILIKKKVGQKVSVEILREGEEMKLDVVLSKLR